VLNYFLNKMKKLKLLIISLVMIFKGISWGEERSLPSWEINGETSYIRYREPGVMKEKGIMYGVNGSYTFRNRFMLKLEGRFSVGQLDYKNSGEINNIDNYIYELRSLGGYSLPKFRSSMLTPYIGIGYRYLNDDSSGKISSTGAWGYEREISYIYSPLGIELFTSLENGWSVILSLEYDYFWDGNVESHLGEIPGYYDVKNDQDKGYGIRGSIKFDKKGEVLDFTGGSFVRYWNIKDSKITVDPAGTAWIEPKNNSLEIGLQLGIKF